MVRGSNPRPCDMVGERDGWMEVTERREGEREGRQGEREGGNERKLMES